MDLVVDYYIAFKRLTFNYFIFIKFNILSSLIFNQTIFKNIQIIDLNLFKFIKINFKILIWIIF